MISKNTSLIFEDKNEIYFALWMRFVEVLLPLDGTKHDNPTTYSEGRHDIVLQFNSFTTKKQTTKVSSANFQKL